MALYLTRMVKNQYGKTWWGQQFLQSLNAIDYDNRLPRGRSYANNGSVISLSINENQADDDYCFYLVG
ncbi:MAG TPA: hypothetical protein PKD56_07830, partial [Chitinophagales bacterium]|nr:hypothetical protein [Chitinophagales bacterium]